MKPLLSAVFLAVAVSFYVNGQTRYDLYQLFSDKGLVISGRSVSLLNESDKKGVRIDEQSGEGLAWLKGVTFREGVIEVDLRGKDVLQQSFIGIAFHGADNKTYDAVYFRPFNFHATDPVRKIHAVQYISHPVYTWKKLREEQNGKYEKAVIDPPDPNGWFHARIEVSSKIVRVFVNNAPLPSLEVEQLSDRGDGMIGLWVGDGSGGDFASLSITAK